MRLFGGKSKSLARFVTRSVKPSLIVRSAIGASVGGVFTSSTTVSLTQLPPLSRQS